MMKITFTITEDEIREVVESMEISKNKLTARKIKTILNYVECDEWLWKDITNSIKLAVQEII